MRNRPTKIEFEKKLDEVVCVIRDAIINQFYELGSFLPSEKQLAKQFNMSNNSIRKALELLAKEGWIIKVPRVGNRVAEGHPPVKLTISTNTMAIRNLSLDGLLEQFQSRYPWIKVIVQNTFGGRSAFGEQDGANPSDLVMIDDYQFQSLEEQGFYKDLKALTTKEHYYPNLNDLFTIDGQLYMQPLIFSPIVLCYNRQHFQEAGIREPDSSWTWDHLMKTAVQLSDGKGRYGFCFHLPSNNRWPLFLVQSGERFQWEGSTLKRIEQSKLLESIKLSKNIIQNRKAFPLYLSENNADIDRMFLEGKISITLNSYMGLNALADSEIDFDICPVPSNEKRSTLTISLGIGINRNSPHQHECTLLINFLTSIWAQNYIRENTLSIPAYGSLPPPSNFTHKPTRYPLYKEIMFTYRTVRDLNLSVESVYKLGHVMKAYWADMLNETELCDRVVQVLS